jgi:hypothetical protein
MTALLFGSVRRLGRRKEGRSRRPIANRCWISQLDGRFSPEEAGVLQQPEREGKIGELQKIRTRCMEVLFWRSATDFCLPVNP